MEVHFYHLERHPLDVTLPVIIEKCLDRDWPVLVVTGGHEMSAQIDQLLWTYRDESFLPHGMVTDERAKSLPVVIGERFEAVNAPKAVIFVSNTELDLGCSAERLIYIFNGRSKESLEKAREQWLRVKEQNLPPFYWQQTSSGAWQRKSDG